jgi:nitrogen regulatory protein P-II 2
MKYIIAIIQPGKVEALYNALSELGVTGLTTTEVHGYGRQKGKTEMYRGAEYVVNFLPKMKVEVAVTSKIAGKVIAAIKAAAETGKIGDGKIFTLDLADAMRIRTGETGAEVL